jgi:hypothetical protein
VALCHERVDRMVAFKTWLWIVEPLGLPLLLLVVIALAILAAATRAGVFGE